MSINSPKLKKALAKIHNGQSVYSVAKELNIPRSSLQNHAHKNGILLSKPKKWAISKEEVFVLRRDGMSFSELSQRAQVSPMVIAKWCHREGIILTQEQNYKNLIKKSNKIKKDQAVELRLKGMFIPDIAKELNCAKSSVSLWLKFSEVDFSEIEEQIKIRCSSKKSKRVSLYKKENTVFKPVKASMVSIDHPQKEKYLLKKYNEDILNERKEKVIKLRRSGLGFSEISSLLGISKITCAKAIPKDYFSLEEKITIKNLVVARTQARRKAGELRPVGGLKKGSERSKFGYYKGIYCSSTYELCWVIYQLDHGKNVQRFSGFLESKNPQFKYYPDFFEEPNHIIEIKGFEGKDVARKTELAESLGYKVSLLKKEDLKEVFEYVDEKYNVKKGTRHTLYDGYKPKYFLVCRQCNLPFFREKLKGRYQERCCSPRCAGLLRAQKNRAVKSSKGLVASIKSNKSYS